MSISAKKIPNSLYCVLVNMSEMDKVLMCTNEIKPWFVVCCVFCILQQDYKNHRPFITQRILSKNTDTEYKTGFHLCTLYISTHFKLQVVFVVIKKSATCEFDEERRGKEWGKCDRLFNQLGSEKMSGLDRHIFTSHIDKK